MQPLLARLLAPVAVLAALALAGCAARHEGPATDHFDGRHFRNAHSKEPPGLLGLLRWRLFEPGADWPAELPGATQSKPPQRVEGDRILVTYVNHATVLVQAGGVNILTDPIWSERASPVSFAGPRRHNPPGVAWQDLPKIDIVLVSHNHYDHLDQATLAALWRRDKPAMVAPLGNAAILRGEASDMVVHELDWTTSAKLGGATVTAMPLQHWSSRFFADRDLSLWASYVVETPAGRIYFAGDTGYGQGDHFKAVGQRFKGVRLALLPIGAYDPRWFMEHPHENPEEAVQAALDTCAQTAMGHHWGTFQLTNEPIMEPPQRLAAEVRRRGLPAGWFRTPLPGQSFELPGQQASTPPSCT